MLRVRSSNKQNANKKLIFFSCAVHVTGSDTQGHLTGSQAIISVASSMHADHPPTGLRRAAYWSAFRQEVWIAPQTQQPICMCPAVCGYAVEHAFAPAPDHVWCERSIAHCGAAMNAALMIDGRQQGKEEQVARWRALMEENERWWRCVPSGFDPFFGSWECREGELFPDVRFQADWHGEWSFLLREGGTVLMRC